MKISRSKVVIIGAGNVGSTTAFSILNQGICDELVLLDLNKEKAFGEVLDLSHSVEFMGRNIRVKVGDYSDCADADVVMITASAPMDPSMTDRLTMFDKSTKIIGSIVKSVMDSGFDGILLLISNPVDVMTYYAWKVSGLPANQVIGSGTTLDTARLKYYIGQRLGIDSRSIDAYVIGEHGNSEMAAWSTATIGGKTLTDVVKDNTDRIGGTAPYNELLTETIEGGFEIFKRKGSTTFGIAASATAIIKAVLYDENRILPVSVKLSGEYGMDDLFISLPAIINRTGVKEIVELNLTEQERKQFTESCSILMGYNKEL